MFHRTGKTSYQKAQIYYDSRNYDQAFIQFTKSAKHNHTLAQVFLGHMYEYGQGILQDDTKASHWYLRAKETSDADFQLVIAYMYHDGNVGGIRNHQKALDWFQTSYKSGNPCAYSCIATLYGTGKGAEKDCKIALDSTMQFADDNTDIVAEVATTYLFGKHNVGQDFNEAESWFIKGVDKEESDSMFGMGLLYAIRTDGNQCWKKAYKWYTYAAKFNHDRAQYALGWLHQHGLGCRKNYTAAMRWYEESMKNGNQDAIASIASFYHYGYSVPVDYLKALTTYEMTKNNPIALNGKGLMYQNGLGVIQSHSVAMSYFKVAAELGYSEAFNSIAEAYQYGYDRDVDLNTAFIYYTKSTECNEMISSKGMFNLGLMYLEGLGTEIDEKVALAWLRKAANYGNERAGEYIDQFVKTSTQLPQVIYNTERIQVIMKERIQLCIQLQTMQEQLDRLTTENELLRRMTIDNGAKDLGGNKRKKQLKFFHIKGKESIELENIPKKFLQI